MRRAELLREQNILLRNRQIRQQMNAGRSSANTGGMIAGGIGAGVSGYGLMSLGARVDEMSTYSTRLNSVFDPNRSASRDAELQRISLLAGVTPATIGGVAYKTMRAAESLGVEGMNAGRAMNVTEAVGLGAALSGSSAEATSAALIQLFQGLESNRLGGEELRSVMEQTPEIARALMKGAGYSDLGEFREASRAGKITGKVMIDALEATLPELRARANQIPITFSRTFSQLGTMLNYFLLDAQKAADITGKFNRAMLALAGTMEAGMREIVANMGGWEIATEKLVAMIAGVAIPVIIRLAMTIFTYMGPLALLAAPLTMVFASLLEFARKYPDEWAAGVAKIKGALGNLVDSILYAMGMRLKPFERSGAQTLASIPLKNKGNGVVEFDGQEFRQDSAELFQAIQRKHPELAAGMEGTGGRMRVMANGKLASEVQQLPNGKQTGSAWVDIIDGLATNIEDTAKWFEDMKPVFHDIRDNIRELVGLIRRIPGLGPVQRAGDLGTGVTGVMKLLGGDIKGGASDVGESVWNLGLGGFLFGGTEEISKSMQRDQQNRQSYANRLNSPYGAGFGNKTDVKIDKIEVNVKEAATKESFIKAVDAAGREAIQSALGKSTSGPFVYPIENTSRATE
jgi:tape measure domain-containing protein